MPLSTDSFELMKNSDLPSTKYVIILMRIKYKNPLILLHLIALYTTATIAKKDSLI